MCYISCIYRGSALHAVNGTEDKLGKDSIMELMAAIESSIPTPERILDKPFLMSIEDTFSISGRGTVATGRIEQGVIKVGDNIDIVGFIPTTKTTVTGMYVISVCVLCIYVCMSLVGVLH